MKEEEEEEEAEEEGKEEEEVEGSLGQDKTLADARGRLDAGAGREMSLDDNGFNKRDR